VEGLCWVLKYYYQGVPSWHWFYPYHYSPFASDFVSIKHLHFHFELGIPFKPFEQLMGVLPSHSKSHLPLPFHDLMTESYSSIYDFYPIDFPIDLNGKKYAWQGVAILPFIDAQRLLDAMKPVYASLTNEETKRNSFGETVLFCGNGSKLFHEACRVYATKDIPEKGLVINHLKSGNIFGKILADPEICFPGSNYQSPLGNCGLRDINPVESVSVVFHMPEYPLGYRFISKMLPGVIMQSRVLDRNDQNMIRSGMPANRDNHHNNNNRSIANAPSVYKRQNDRYEKRDYTRNESSYQQGGRASTYQNNLQSNNNRAQQFGGNRPQNAFSSNMQQQPFGGSRPQNAFSSEAYATRLANSTHIRQVSYSKIGTGKQLGCRQSRTCSFKHARKQQ
jgi:5'-3' exoribonuclease 2